MNDTCADPPKFWLPADWQDEVIPEPRETPDAWIVLGPDGTPMLAGVYQGPLGASTDPDDGEDRPWGSPRILTDGETVAFNFTRNWGSASVTVNEDGSWTVDREMPEDANIVSVAGEWESASDTIAALMGDNDYGSEPGVHPIQYYEWSGDIPFIFDAATRRFMPNEPQA